MKKLRNALLILLVAIALLTADSNLRLTVTEYTLSAANLPASFDGYRIVQLSDLHGKEFGDNNRRLVETVKQLQPDLIALTGDYIECEEDLPVTTALTAQLTAIAPVYFSSGNHDWASGAVGQLRQTITDCGATYLSNTCLELERGGDSIILAGVEDPNSRADMPHPDEVLEKVFAKYPDKFIALLAHRNDFPMLYPDLPCDVIFTGHGHGGVVRLPIVGGILGTDLTLFPKYDAGLFTSGRYTMVVSRGLGDAPYIPRFLNNPEIVVVTLEQK